MTGDRPPSKLSFGWWWPGGDRTVSVEIDLPPGTDDETRAELQRLVALASGIRSGDALADAFSDFGDRHGLRMMPVDILDADFWQIRFV